MVWGNKKSRRNRGFLAPKVRQPGSRLLPTHAHHAQSRESCGERRQRRRNWLADGAAVNETSSSMKGWKESRYGKFRVSEPVPKTENWYWTYFRLVLVAPVSGLVRKLPDIVGRSTAH